MPKPEIPDIATIMRTNPRVNADIVAESLRLIEALRAAGVGKPDYNLLSPKEASLRVDPKSMTYRRSR